MAAPQQARFPTSAPQHVPPTLSAAAHHRRRRTRHRLRRGRLLHHAQTCCRTLHPTASLNAMATGGNALALTCLIIGGMVGTAVRASAVGRSVSVSPISGRDTKTRPRGRYTPSAPRLARSTTPRDAHRRRLPCHRLCQGSRRLRPAPIDSCMSHRVSRRAATASRALANSIWLNGPPCSTAASRVLIGATRASATASQASGRPMSRPLWIPSTLCARRRAHATRRARAPRRSHHSSPAKLRALHRRRRHHRRRTCPRFHRSPPARISCLPSPRRAKGTATARGRSAHASTSSVTAGALTPQPSTATGAWPTN